MSKEKLKTQNSTFETDTTAYLNMDLLRFTTAGSVDDGKSTLIGRLLYDSKAIFEDQLEAIERTSKLSGEEEVNLALLTDGLRAEREQKITIDVAYRYFATPKRKFIIADTPGHEQYTRNMVTGASTADLAIILVDASKGVLTQSKRHAFISSLLRIPHLVVAINKMDLVDYDENVFEEILKDFNDFARKLEITDVTFIPISALKGDNVVDKSEKMPWYDGSTLLHHLEHVRVDATDNVIDFRFPVQSVIRPNANFRGFAGRVVSGHIKPGDSLKILPSGLVTRVKDLVHKDGNQDQVRSGDSTIITTTEEVDISRGDMIVRKNNVPTVGNNIDCYLCWMSEDALDTNKSYIIRHTSKEVQGYVKSIDYHMNVDTLSREKCTALKLNEIGRVKLQTSKDLFFDPYRINKATGSFIVIDAVTNVTVGAGMIRSGVKEIASEEEKPDHSKLKTQNSPNVVWEPWNISRKEREARNGHKAKVIWFTGISGSGKSTIAKALEKQLWAEGKQTVLLDGDQLRHGLNGDLGFSPEDRSENIRRVGHLARLFYEHGNIVLCTFISPYIKDREIVRSLFEETTNFIEVYVKCDPEIAQQRDPKGLYKKAKKGEIKGLTGYDAEYQESKDSGLILETDKNDIDTCVRQLIGHLG